MSPTTLLLIMISLFGGLRADDPIVPIVKKLSMSKITITDTTVDVCFTVDTSPADDPPDFTTFSLTVGLIAKPSDSKEYTMTEAYTTGGTCLTFNDKFEEHAGKEIFFILQGVFPKKEATLITGTEYITLAEEATVIEGSEYITLAAIPPSVTAQWVGEKGVHGSTLRVNEKVGGWDICIDGELVESSEFICSKTSGKKPCYAVNIGPDVSEAAEDKLSLCDTTDANVPVIVKSIAKPGTADITGTGGPTPTNITLDSGSKTILTDAVPDDTNEALIYKGTEKKGIVCDTVATCNLGAEYTPDQSGTKLQILMITIDGSKVATGSSLFPFLDFNLHVFKLEETILEAAWKFHEINKYTAVRNYIGEVSDDSQFHEVSVDCTNNKGFCYAYYVKVSATGVYTVTTTPTLSNDDNADDNSLNSITSASIDMSKYRASGIMDNSLKNITIDKQYNKESGNLELNICFTYDSTKIMDNGQLEVIIISTNKQLRKVVEESTHQVTRQSCYSTTFLLESDNYLLSPLTALVIQRDVNTGEVLAYHRSDLDLTAPRNIKPDVDNGGEGSTSTLAIVGAAIGGVACLVALAAMVTMFVMKLKSNNDGHQYPLHRYNIEDSSTIHGLDNPIPTN